MSLEKEVVIDQVEVTENGSVQVRKCTKIKENGAVISKSYHRHVIVPGADYSAEDAKVQAICAAAHTSDVIDAYQAAIAAQGV